MGATTACLNKSSLDLFWRREEKQQQTANPNDMGAPQDVKETEAAAAAEIDWNAEELGDDGFLSTPSQQQQQQH